MGMVRIYNMGSMPYEASHNGVTVIFQPKNNGRWAAKIEFQNFVNRHGRELSRLVRTLIKISDEPQQNWVDLPEEWAAVIKNGRHMRPRDATKDPGHGGDLKLSNEVESDLVSEHEAARRAREAELRDLERQKAELAAEIGALQNTRADTIKKGK